MAVTFSITSTGLDTLDLTYVGSQFSLQPDKYLPVVATPTGDGSIPPYVTETIPVMLTEVTYDAYASSMQVLATHQKRAAEYWVNQQQATPVWLNCKLDGESFPRRALVKAIHFEFRPWIQALYQECGTSVAPDRQLGTLLIERHPYWEDPTPREFINTTPAAAASVVYDYLIEPGGDVPCRINGLGWRATVNTLERFWMGIRSATLHGATGVTAFIPVWECEDATLVVDNAIAADGGGTEPNTASPGGGSGDYVNVDPEAAGAVIDWDDGAYHPVLAWTLTDVGYTTFSDAAGRFLWILRTKAQSGEWSLRLVSGYGSYALAQGYLDPVSVVNTDWDYKEMGVSTIPTRSRKAIESIVLADGLDRLAYMVVEAQRISGVGDLRVDCLCPVPVDEGFLKVSRGSASPTTDTWFGEGPKGDTQVVHTTDAASDYTRRNEPYEEETFRIPPGDGRIICVYAQAANSVLTDRIEFADTSVGVSKYTERWVSLAGVE